MSEATTPSSRSRSPASSQASGRTPHSDTTPSPSGGNRSPSFNPHKLSSKLALLEASESLAYAAETLSVAAKAMSKAAASLAAASGYEDHDYEYEAREPKAKKPCTSEDWISSPDWTQASYTLAPPDEGIYELDERYVLGSTTSSSKESEVNSIPTHIASETLPPADAINLHKDSSGEPSTSTPKLVPAPFASIPPAPAERKPPTASVTDFGPVAPNPLDWANPLPAQSTTRQGIATGNRGSTMTPSIPATAPISKPTIHPTTAKLTPSQTPSTSASAANKSNTHTEKLSRIVLDRGFDALPALCAILKRCAKTVCFYPNTGGSAMHTVGQVLKAHTNQGVIIPTSLKPEKLLVAGQKFSSAESSVLVWPSILPLSGVTDLESPNTQIVYLGEPLKETASASTICPRTTIILTKSEITNLKANTAESLTLKCAIDPLNDAYNTQGVGSPLHSFRSLIRSRLSDMSFARSFYWGWILHHRKQNPSWTAVQLIHAANRYAEEYLLRGDSRDYGEPVGGRVSITRVDANGQKLQPAVQAGILLVC